MSPTIFKRAWRRVWAIPRCEVCGEELTLIWKHYYCFEDHA